MIDTRLSRQILNTIAVWIVCGELSADGSLPSLKRLAELFGVSVVTVREAVIGLQTLGVVEMRHGRGIFVLSPHTVLEDMYRTRRDLETLMARRASVSITASEIEVLRNHVTLMQEGAERQDVETYRAHDTPFHATTFLASGLSIMSSIVSLLKSGVFSPGSYIHDELARDSEYLITSNKEHWALFDAMSSGDPDKAEAAVHAHLDRVYSTWNRNLDSMRAKVKSELAQMK